MATLPRNMALLSSLEESDMNVLVDMCITGELQAHIKLRKQKPKVSQRISEDILPESEPVLEYIEELERRKTIFEELHHLQAQFSLPNQVDGLDMAALGIVMVAPIPYLEAFLEELRPLAQTGNQAMVTALLLSLSHRSLGIKAYANKGGRQPSVSKSAQDSAEFTPEATTPKLSRNKNASRSCKKRDKNECILTGTVDPEEAHIVPFGILSHGYFALLRSLIQKFWGEEQAKIWLDLIRDASVTESPKNLLSLNHQIHWWFDNGIMALKPLRQLDDGSVVVQFHWLKRHQLKSTTKFGGNINDFMQNAGLEDNSAWGDILAYGKDGVPLRTGQIFTLKADKDKPESAPSFELLKLSWDMLRIIAISGAADPKKL